MAKPANRKPSQQGKNVGNTVRTSVCWRMLTEVDTSWRAEKPAAVSNGPVSPAAAMGCNLGARAVAPSGVNRHCVRIPAGDEESIGPLRLVGWSGVGCKTTPPGEGLAGRRAVDWSDGESNPDLLNAIQPSSR